MKAQTKKHELLWNELTAINDQNGRRALIFEDTKLEKPKYRPLADSDPGRLLDILGGNIGDAYRWNWAYKYTYENHLEQVGGKYDQTEADNWNLEAQSKAYADETGHYYVTGMIILEVPGEYRVVFEIDYTEGYFNSFINTPYTYEQSGNNHGILLYS
ncbi:hypothetical protein [Gilvibacter sp.]|uniref:hypothetical protein n=1 Tax=Gilvibacter sp. TaxID=2729997 RepID=UPI003B528983